MIRVGIDLGADHVRLVTAADGIIYDEACRIALDARGNVLAIGDEAKELRTSMHEDIRIISPLESNSVDFDALYLLLEQLIYDFKFFRMFQKTTLLFSVPMSLSDEQCEELKESLLDFGAYRVYFDREIWVAAIGAQLNLFIPVTSCVLNLGSSNCDIAVFSNGSMHKQSRFKVSGRHVDLLIKRWLLQQFNLQVSDQSVERIKKEVGQTIRRTSPKSIRIEGLNTRTQQLESMMINENMLADVLQPLCRQWANWIYRFLCELSKEQQEDVRMRGIICCGGTMLLKGLRETLQEQIGCPVYVTDDPLNTVAQGLQILLARMDS